MPILPEGTHVNLIGVISMMPQPRTLSAWIWSPVNGIDDDTDRHHIQYAVRWAGDKNPGPSFMSESVRLWRRMGVVV